MGDYSPHDYELRVVPESEGSFAYYGFTTGRIARVPIQIWDIGTVTPGQPNDPADDVRLVPALFASAPNARADTTAAAECTFAFNGPETSDGAGGTGASTQRIYAYYPVDDYNAWAAAAQAVVGADGSGCAAINVGAQPRVTDPAAELIDFGRRPLQRDVFVQAGATTRVSDLEGTVIRYYTLAGSTPAEPEPLADGPALAAPFPNPATSRTTVRYRTATAGPVRLTVLDLLGREVVRLADGPRSPGEHRAELATSGLAAGVYFVVLEADRQRVARTLTVTR